MRNVKVGLISFAHPHAISYLNALLELPDVAVAGIADEDRGRVQAHVERAGCPYYADYRDLLRTDVDAVIICSENALHCRLTVDAARHGKHVLCEKPLGTSLEEMRRMVEACRESGVRLMTAFPNRYIPMIVKAKEALERGEIGSLLAVKATNKGAMPGGWFVDRALSGGGAVMDHTVHVADLLHWILGAEGAEVYAESGTLFYDLPIDDAGMVNIVYANGVRAVLDTSWSRTEPFPYKRDLTMELIGTGGVISIDYFAQVNEVYSSRKTRAEWSYWGDNKDRLLIRDFIRCLRTGEPFPITGEDGLKATAVALAAYESARTGKPVKPE